MPIRSRILRLEVDLVKNSELLDSLLRMDPLKKPSYICFANVHMLIEAYRDASVRKAVNSSTLTLTDGMPLVMALRFLYGIKQERITGMDFMPALMKEAEIKGESVFLFGATIEILDKIESRAILDYPELKIAGKISPPFGKLFDKDIVDHVRIINDSKAKYVFVSLGCPKQELWMAGNSPRINAILLGVGGAFEVYAGTKKRAPEWMRKYSLEWFYRLIQEPARLIKRYLVTNSYFVILLAIQYLQIKFFGIFKIKSRSDLD